jgi:hypothetical protein
MDKEGNMPFTNPGQYKAYQAAYYLTHRKKRIAAATLNRHRRTHTGAGRLAEVDDLYQEAQEQEVEGG